MSDVERYTDIHTVEVLAAGQGMRYTYTGGIITFHDKAGDKTFNWLLPFGIKNTLQWFEEKGKRNVSETCPDCGHSSYHDDCSCKCHCKCL